MECLAHSPFSDGAVTLARSAFQQDEDRSDEQEAKVTAYWVNSRTPETIQRGIWRTGQTA